MARPPTPAHGSHADDAWVPRAGTVIAGRYTVERLIGKGGMAVVVAARHMTLGERVAIKILHPRLATDAEGSERFFREARATARIRSEHVVRVVDVGTTDAGLPFIVMELLLGSDLGQMLDSGAIATAHAVDFVLQASEALAEAHSLGIVHRDLKPSNLWLARRPDGSPLVKVLDFGISKLSVEVEGDPKLTETQSIFGSPMYMSPEQIRSAKRVDHRTDVWGIGVVLYELLSGALPFDAHNAASALASITADEPAPLGERRPDVPPELEAAIFHCLRKDVSKRCQSLAELAGLLAPFASPIGKISAERIGRINAPHASLTPIVVATSSGRILGDPRPTETAFAARGSSARTPHSPALGVGLGVGFALFIVVLILIGMKLGAASSAAAASGAALLDASPAAPTNARGSAVAAAPQAPAAAPTITVVATGSPLSTSDAAAEMPAIDLDGPSTLVNRPKLVPARPHHGYAHGRK